MNNTILYHEVQRFRQWWFWLIIIVTVGIGVTNTLMTASDDKSIYPLIFIPVVVILLLFSMNLDTKITNEGVDVKSFPLMMRGRHYAWSDIVKAYTREYAPIKEYGGWGIKGSYNNRAFNVSGKQGLQLELKDGRYVLIGTQKPSEIDAILKSINKHNA